MGSGIVQTLAGRDVEEFYVGLYLTHVLPKTHAKLGRIWLSEGRVGPSEGRVGPSEGQVGPSEG